jgi:hypothetical protein
MVNIGKWSFVIGVILAILAGFLAIPNLAIVLLILGLIVGFLNISAKETTEYLIAVIALLVIGVASIQAMNALGIVFTEWLQGILANFIAFVAASGLVVAIKAILELGQSEQKS